jgi:hypothetical protein
MNNTQGASSVPLTVFGGAVTEMAPEDLPEGASPFNQDVDYYPGNVTTRGGRSSQYYFDGLFAEEICKFAASVPGSHPGQETPWTNPTNATLGIPGTYAEAKVNHVTVAVDGIGDFDTAATGFGSSTTIVSTATATPAEPSEIALFLCSSFFTMTPAGGWSNFSTISPGNLVSQIVSAGIAGGGTLSSSGQYAAAVMLFKLFGLSAPTVVQLESIVSGSLSAGTYHHTLLHPVAAGNTLLVFAVTNTHGECVFSISDSQGNLWVSTAAANSGSAIQDSGINVYRAQNVLAGSPNAAVVVTGTSAGGSLYMMEIQGGQAGANTGPYSEILRTLNYGFAIPSTVVPLGFQVEISGKQSTTNPASILTVGLTNPGPTSPTFDIQLPASNGQVTVATPVTNWNLKLTNDLFNNPNFGIDIVASAIDGTDSTFDVYAVKVKVWLTPDPAVNFNWIKTYEQEDGAVTTLALDGAGVLWQEDVINDPGVFHAISDEILPGSFAKSETFDDVEFIGINDLTQGTDVPRLWDGSRFRRVSQVGPGAPPQINGIASGSDIVNITQHAAVAIPTSTGGKSGSWVLWSASGAANGAFGAPATPGNVMTWVFPKAFAVPAYLKIGSNIVISGVQTMNGFNPNNGAGTNPAYYTLIAVGQPDPHMDYYDAFSFVIPQTGFYNNRFTTAGSVTFQATEATLTAATQVPYLEVGSSMQVESNSKADYNNTWTVDETPNAAQLSITNTSLIGGIATYSFVLVTGTTPSPGQFVTTTGLLNGGNVFNVRNAVINTAGANSFTIAIAGPDVTGAAETGNGIINGTIFLFDPAGVVANPIIGTGTGGTIATFGVIGVGVRRCVCMFVTDTGLITGASPYVEFNIAGADSAISASQIPLGPADTVARILAFTAANGGNFYYIPIPVTVLVNGQNVIYNSTIINDNVTTTATISFPDTVLTGGIQIDIQGNNLFNQIELGSSLGFVSYSSRLFAIGEQNKIQNLLNLSFDGGVGIAGAALQNLAQAVVNYPLGWTVDPVNGSGGSVIDSPVFGGAYYVINNTGSLAATFGMIEQSAYQDQYQVPIVQAAKTYNVRITVGCPTQIGSGNVVVDLFSPSLNQVYGSFTIPLASMESTPTIFTGTLLTQAFPVVPNDLLFRVYGTQIPAGGDFEIDRVEPFDATLPVFSTQLRASYANNPQAFDLVTGAAGPNQNSQPILGAFTLFDNLYVLKTKSAFSTSDNGVTEPNRWSWREVSNKVGTVGIHSYDYGEGWAVTANRAGVYFFDGGEPIKIGEEIQTLWDMINWKYGNSIWLRNDPTKRQISIGVPIATGPNAPSFAYLPEFPTNANPTTPNVIIIISYRELNSGRELASVGPIRASYSGRLLSPEPARKPGFWNIACPYADFINRGDNNEPEFYCSGYQDSKVFALDPVGDDDGEAINSFYITYGFVKPDMADAKGLGLHRMQIDYLTALAVGSGDLLTWIYPDSVQNDLPFVLDPLPLDAISYGDLELGGANGLKGQRFFMRFGTNAIGARFRLSKVVLDMVPDPWSPIRGSAKGSR